MSKTITIIDLLNKIANGEEFPKKVKFEDKIYTYCNKMTDYKNEDYFLFDMISDGCVKDFLNDKVKIIEEQEEIDIQDLQEYEFPGYVDIKLSPIEKKLLELINQNRQAVKQLDKNIKEK